MFNIFQTNSWLNKLLHNSGWMMLAQGSRVIDILVRSIIIARLLSLESFAAYAVSMAFVGLVTELANLNIGAVVMTYGVRYQQEGQQEHLKALIKIGYIVTLVVAVIAGLIIAALLAISYDTFIKQPGLYGPILVLGIAAAFNLLDTINKPILRLVDRFKASCILDVVTMMVNIAFVFTFLTIMPKTSANAIYSAAVCLLIFAVAGTTVTWVILASVAPGWWTANISVLANGWKSMTRMMVGNSLASSIQRLMRKGDILLLAALAPVGVVGLYDIGKKLASMVLLLRDAITLAAFPQIAKAIATGQQEKLRGLIFRFFKIGIPASGFVILAVWILSKLIIDLSFGTKYTEASVVFTVLTISSLLYLLFFWATALMLNSRRVKAQLFANSMGLVAMVIAGLVLVPIWQSVGMAWAVVIGVSIQFGIVGIVAWKIQHDKSSALESRADS